MAQHCKISYCRLNLVALFTASLLLSGCGQDPTPWRHDKDSENPNGDLSDASGEDPEFDSDWEMDSDGYVVNDEYDGYVANDDYDGDVANDENDENDEEIFDLCPNDPDKVAPGICGCKVPDIDIDHDGVPDCHDECPADKHKTKPGTCGCGTRDSDKDDDGVPDCDDDCPLDPEKVEPGVCGCFIAEGTCDFGKYLETPQDVYDEGDDAVVFFSNLPNFDDNWIGLYVAGAAHDDMICYFYVTTWENGYVRYKELRAGSYEARLFFNDSWVMEDQVSFTVR